VKTSFVLVATALLALALPPDVRAEPENEGQKVVRIVGLNPENAAFALVDPGPSAECFFSLIGFDHKTVTGRLWYASLLDALARGAKIDVAYERSDRSCIATQINFYP